MKTSDEFPQQRCVSCGRFFVPDRRIGQRQKCCQAQECRKKRKRIQEQAWKERNPDYFQDFYASYVKPWRMIHSGYQIQWRARKRLRDKMAHEIKTEIRPASPIKSMRLHLRCNLRFNEIKTQLLRVTQAGQAFWVDGAGMQAA
jgi:hypothetical protein